MSEDTDSVDAYITRLQRITVLAREAVKGGPRKAAWTARLTDAINQHDRITGYHEAMARRETCPVSPSTPERA
jgi:hypothetical protein